MLTKIGQKRMDLFVLVVSKTVISGNNNYGIYSFNLKNKINKQFTVQLLVECITESLLVLLVCEQHLKKKRGEPHVLKSHYFFQPLTF